MVRASRPISWIKAARKEFEKFPAEAQTICLTALTVAAEGGNADIAKPMSGLGSGVWEIALPFREMPFAWFMLSRWEAKYGLFTPSKRRRRKESKRRSTKSI